MIAGIFHEGSGLGNQLFRYVATRVLALDKGYEFGMVNQYCFKGKSFMELDMGKQIEPSERLVNLFNKEFKEKKIMENGIDIRGYDPEFNFIEDDTIIEGEFQDERYFGHRMKEINEWLKVEPLNIPDDVCVIGFRGGEYYTNPDLGLPKEYYEEAIKEMRAIGIKKFEVHTDDLEMAKNWFPNFKVFHDIELNWRATRYAKYAIIANSSFYILPRLLNGGLTIAPRYWARHNTKTWSMAQNYYKSFKYI